MLYSTLASPGHQLHKKLDYKSWLDASVPDCHLTPKIGHLQKKQQKLHSNPRYGSEYILVVFKTKNINEIKLTPLFSWPNPNFLEHFYIWLPPFSTSYVSRFTFANLFKLVFHNSIWNFLHEIYPYILKSFKVFKQKKICKNSF